ncbi:MAG: oligoribonuclease [Thiomonas sp. 14-64-326]|nr:MAG: oligoribonuclease [Thiomonas sp. 14-64-326]
MSDSATSAAPILTCHDDNLIWVDMEMTGLNPDTDRIIEVAVVVTDPQLTVRVEGPVLAIHQSDAVLAGMDAWNQNTHGKSGLTDRVRASTVDEAQASKAIIAFLKKYVPAGKSPMCGNTICQDRRFMARGMPELETYFHYRNLELADIQESIDELRHYREHFLRVPVAGVDPEVAG